jgi:hypothetical protein
LLHEMKLLLWFRNFAEHTHVHIMLFWLIDCHSIVLGMFGYVCG